jgi:hypothetical protein
MHPDELLREKQDTQAKWERERGSHLIQEQAKNMCAGAPVEQHPREILLADLNDQEQRLLDKLHALRDIRLEICALPRDEAKRLLTISRLTQQLQP